MNYISKNVCVSPNTIALVTFTSGVTKDICAGSGVVLGSGIGGDAKSAPVAGVSCTELGALQLFVILLLLPGRGLSVYISCRSSSAGSYVVGMIVAV